MITFADFPFIKWQFERMFQVLFRYSSCKFQNWSESWFAKLLLKRLNSKICILLTMSAFFTLMISICTQQHYYCFVMRTNFWTKVSVHLPESSIRQRVWIHLGAVSHRLCNRRRQEEWCGGGIFVRLLQAASVTRSRRDSAGGHVQSHLPVRQHEGMNVPTFHVFYQFKAFPLQFFMNAHDL